MVTRKKAVTTEVVAEEKKRYRYTTFPVEVAFPTDEEGKYTYRPIGVAETFNIARDTAYSLARQGLRMRYPRPENERNDTDGWYSVSPETALNIAKNTWERYATEAIADRAMILSNEMKARSRVGNIIGELRGVAEITKSDPAKQAIRRGMLDIARAAFAPIGNEDIQSIGLNMEADYMDILIEAAAAQGVNLDHTCESCGEVHAGEMRYTPQQLLAMADQEWLKESDPIAEALEIVEGMHA